MKPHTFFATLALLPMLDACTPGHAGQLSLASRPEADTCLVEPGQAFIGRTASSATGAEMLAATQAREIRWVPPRTAVTMEYKYGRLTVGYDDARVITSVSCS